MFISFVKTLFKTIDKTKTETYIGQISFAFYLLLWLADPNNKLTVLLFGLLLFLYYIKLKEIRKSLIICYFAGIIIPSGKTYSIELIPPGVYQDYWYSQGYMTSFVITPAVIVAIIASIILIRDLFLGYLKKENKNKLNIFDIFLILYFSFNLFTDGFVSSRPNVSLLVGTANLWVIIMYFFIRFYKDYFPHKQVLITSNKVTKSGYGSGLLIRLLVSLMISQLAFESLVSLQQFMISSPVYKNIEAGIVTREFGEVVDELAFRFRPPGTMVHANNFAGWISFYLSIIFSYNLLKKNKYYNLVIILAFFALVITLSRSAWIGVFIAVFFVLHHFEKLKKISFPKLIVPTSIVIITLASVLSVYFIFPRLEKSLYSLQGGLEFRKMQIQSSSLLISRNIFFGVGTSMSVVEMYRSGLEGIYKEVPYALHNWYLLTLVEHGIFSLILFISFITILLRRKWVEINKFKHVDEKKAVVLGFFAGTLSLIFIGMFHPFLWENLIVLVSAILYTDNV